MMFKLLCGFEIRKKPFVAISSRLIQYNDWTIVTLIKFAKFHHYTPNNKNVMMGGGGAL